MRLETPSGTAAAGKTQSPDNERRPGESHVESSRSTRRPDSSTVVTHKGTEFQGDGSVQRCHTEPRMTEGRLGDLQNTRAAVTCSN